MLHLSNAFCKPLLVYASECVSFNVSLLRRMTNVWNTVYWKLFDVDGTSVPIVESFTGQKPVAVSICERKLKFLSNLCCCTNVVMNGLYSLLGKTEIKETELCLSKLVNCTL
jgi:hypothetical protein